MLTGPTTRAIVILGGITVLGGVMVGLRFRGNRHLPSEVRAGLASDHRN